MKAAKPRLTTRVLGSFARMGRAGRVITPQLDSMRTLGLPAWSQRVRAATDIDAQQLSDGQTQVYRRIWEQTATAVGADLDELADGYLIASRDGVQTVLYRQLVMLDHPVTLALALDKSLVHRLLAENGLPVPQHLETQGDDRAAALSYLRRSNSTCVVKPANGTSGGLGVTCGVETGDDLLRASLQAARWDDRILIEHETPGDEYRLLFLEGELLGIVQRRRPCVTGTGTMSVLSLIEAENQRRLQAAGGDVSRLIRIDLDCELAVRRSGASLHSVLAAGKRITVKSTVGENATAENSTLRHDDVSPQLVREAAHAARLLHIQLAGIDLVTPDPTRSLVEAGGTILEVNATPGLHYHYQVANPAHAAPVAVPILKRLLETGSKSA